MSFADDVLTKVKKEVLEKLENGNSKFAIYPYGNHGVRIANLLKECFYITPDYIVDNTLCKYNKRIISFDKFKKVYTNDVCVILTVENLEVNEEMYNALKEFVKEDNIINIIKSGQIEIRKVAMGGYKLNNLLPRMRQVKINTENTESTKIKVRFAYRRPNTWNVIKTICEAFNNDKRYDVLIILNNSFYENHQEKQMKLYGYSYIHSDEYNAVYDRPDIFISSEGYLDKENCMNIRKTAKLVVATSMVMNNFFLNIEDLCIQNFDAAYQDIDPDYFLLDSAIYQELSEYGYKKDKLVEMGNAKYDGIYETCKRKVYQPEWEKLKGRKTVLWITTHGVYPYNKNFYTSIDLYARTIFEYFEENDDLGLIFRPNSQLFRDLFRLGIWKEGDVRKIGDYCNRTSNVVFDDSDSYDNAFSVADAIITDEMCGVIYSGLPTMKPICITYRSDSYLRPNKDKVLNNYYSASSNEELVGYLEMINAGKDPMYDLRKAASEKYVKNFDGKNGERIKEFVEEKYFELVQ